VPKTPSLYGWARNPDYLYIDWADRGAVKPAPSIGGPEIRSTSIASRGAVKPAPSIGGPEIGTTSIANRGAEKLPPSIGGP